MIEYQNYKISLITFNIAAKVQSFLLIFTFSISSHTLTNYGLWYLSLDVEPLLMHTLHSVLLDVSHVLVGSILVIVQLGELHGLAGHIQVMQVLTCG